RARLTQLAEQLRQGIDTEDGRLDVEAILRSETAHQRALDENLALRRTDTPLDDVTRMFATQVVPLRDALDRDIAAFVDREQRLLRLAETSSTDAATAAMTTVGVVTL